MFFTEKELAAVLKVSIPTLKRWRASGIGPAWLRIGTRIRYPQGAVAVWIEKSQVSPVHPPAA